MRQLLQSVSSNPDSYNELTYIEAMHEAFMSVCQYRKGAVGMSISEP